VFSLDPIPGYEPPLLAGHKDAIVAVFFTGPLTRRAALVDGKPLPVLCTLSRDGALMTWTFTPSLRLAGDAAGTTVVERTGPAPKRQRLPDGRAAAAAAAAAAEAKQVALEAGEEEGEGDNDPAVMPHLSGMCACLAFKLLSVNIYVTM
jgi:periodic tryptophan protein 2